ncbi:MAG: flagellar biosynthesis protein FlhA [Rhodospirillales bacterium]|nr:flagellar biosynthesis protein FlhA [Alphaproteobacteria bacterium]MCB9987110.1 flagellar biosynthesis protein FlhA [Rhodospirillales bacterium]USO08131.1 MAG: flagellar biosynthesis protein FlhA [Rhodospirillales bacterium]
MARGDVLLALAIIAIICGLIFPMPTWLLDISLALSITFSVLILMTVLFIERPLDFTTFPTVLLIATMLRLSLNVATTRLILANGQDGTDAAGHVIKAFGSFIMGDNFVIGLIVFAILIIINFVVITKGSGRIAEVAARFSLDAMPGKQMAIDSDMSAGLITEEQARTRRSELEQESNFYGAMDGAAKFVRGDAIAGLIITFVNIVGGIIIGTVQHDMSIGDATHSYTFLTAGDGLVSQIPALLVSIAAGLLVSKGGVSGSADKALFKQFSQYPKGLALTAGTMSFLAIMPGLPFIPFATLAGAMGGLSWMIQKQNRAKAAARVQQAAIESQKAKPAEEPISKSLAMDIIRLELGYGLLTLVNGEGQKLTDQIKGLRRQLAEEMGFVLPSVRIQDNLQLTASDYVVRIKEIEAGRGTVRPGMLLCMDPAGEPISLPGEATTEPTFGLPAMWLDEQYREEANFRGYTVVDASTVVTTHLTEVVKDNMADLLSYTETQKLLDEMGKPFQKLVADVIPGQISLSGLQRVLQNLLSERISIRDLPTILEGISEASLYTKSVALISEHVRSRLARQICTANMNTTGVLPLVTLSPEWEQAFSEALMGEGEERQLVMAPSQLQQFIARVRDIYEDFQSRGEAPVLLTSPGIRPYVRSVVERFRAATVVMSQNEIHPKVRIKTVGQV